MPPLCSSYWPEGESEVPEGPHQEAQHQGRPESHCQTRDGHGDDVPTHFHLQENLPVKHETTESYNYWWVVMSSWREEESHKSLYRWQVLVMGFRECTVLQNDNSTCKIAIAAAREELWHEEVQHTSMKKCCSSAIPESWQFTSRYIILSFG